MGQILLSVTLLKSVYWRCFYTRSRSPSDMYRVGSLVCVFWHASSDLLRLSWKCQRNMFIATTWQNLSPESMIMDSPRSVQDPWEVYSRFHGSTTRLRALKGEKKLLVAWNSNIRARRAAATFLWGTGIRVPLVVRTVIRGVSPWRCLVASLALPPAGEGWMGCAGQREILERDWSFCSFLTWIRSLCCCADFSFDGIPGNPAACAIWSKGSAKSKSLSLFEVRTWCLQSQQRETYCTVRWLQGSFLWRNLFIQPE